MITKAIPWWFEKPVKSSSARRGISFIGRSAFLANLIASEIFSSNSTFIATTNSLAGIFARSASTTEFLPATASCIDPLRSNLFSGRSPLRSSRLTSRSFVLTGLRNPLRASPLSSRRLSLFSGRATALRSTLLLLPREKVLAPFGRSLRALPGFINNSTLDHWMCLLL